MIEEIKSGWDKQRKNDPNKATVIPLPISTVPLATLSFLYSLHFYRAVHALKMETSDSSETLVAMYQIHGVTYQNTVMSIISLL